MNIMNIIERSSGYWIVNDCGIIDGPWLTLDEAISHLEEQQVNQK